MSKVVASEEGVKKTRSLFEGLNVAQEDLIPVYYKQEIALITDIRLIVWIFYIL